MRRPREALTDVPAQRGSLVHALTLEEVGRVVQADEDSATVEFFDVPGEAGTFSRVLPIRDLRPAKLHWQTRVHWIDDGMWRHGRVLDHVDRDRIVVRRKMVDRDLREDEVIVRRRAPARD